MFPFFVILSDAKDRGLYARHWLLPVLVTIALVMACGGPLTSVQATATAITRQNPFVSDKLTCTRELSSEREEDFEVLEQVMYRYLQALREIPGVHGVGIGGLKVGGLRTNELVIEVLVSPHVIETNNEVRELIPRTLEGCKVQIKLSDEGQPI